MNGSVADVALFVGVALLGFELFGVLGAGAALVGITVLFAILTVVLN